MHLAVVDRMAVVSKALVFAISIFAGAVTAGTSAAIMARLARARRGPGADGPVAGSMFVGAVSEVELGAGIARPMRPQQSPEVPDPEEVPSEHPEINELREQMPFG